VAFGEITQSNAADHVMAQYWLMGGAPEIDRTRHGRRTNHVFLDGHASTLRFENTFDMSRSVDLWNPATAQ
jgi:prepilin-type processing-associated H-X9-DG protein